MEHEGVFAWLRLFLPKLATHSMPATLPAMLDKGRQGRQCFHVELSSESSGDG